MRLFTLVSCFVLLGCSSVTAEPTDSTPLGVEPVNAGVASVSSGEVCRQADLVEAEGGAEMILEGVARAQTNDLRCGPPDDRTRICRALFLLSVLDPALHLQDGRLDQTVNAVGWALNDAATIAAEDLASALDAVAAANTQLLNASDDERLAAAISARADPEVLNPIDEHWQTNCV